MFQQPALASSAFAGLHDELLAYWTLFCSIEDLLVLSEVNSGASAWVSFQVSTTSMTLAAARAAFSILRVRE